MKTIYSLIFMLCFSTLALAQRVVSANPFLIPSSGTVTITIKCHNAFLVTHNVTSARLFQPTNLNGSTFTSVSKTIIDNNHMTATFNISNPVHGGYYNVAIFETGYIVNYLVNGVYMTGTEERRLLSATPCFGRAGTTLTSLITAKGAHFMTATGFQWIGFIQLQSEIDNSIITGSNISYIDSDYVNTDFVLPANAVNGTYKLMVDLQSQSQTSMPRMFTVYGGLNKRITSVTPNKGGKGTTTFLHVHVVGRNLITNPVTYASLIAESALYYTIYTTGGAVTTVDSNNLIIRFTIDPLAPVGDYTLQLNNNLIKHYAFRIVPPNITGQIYFDRNSNGVKDANDNGIGSHRVLLLPDSIFAITNNDGSYFYYVDSGTYTLQYVTEPFWALTTLPSTYNVAVDDSVISNLNFGIYRSPYYDHSFSIYERSLRCNATGYSAWTVYNTSTVVHQGTITHVHSSNLPVTYTSIAPYYSGGDTLKWLYTVNPGQSLSCYIYFQDPSAGTAVWYTNTDQLYDSLGVLANIYEERLDITVTCSCDPNDKRVIPAQDAQHPTTPVASDLIYTIRFQNTGNDTAFLVVIADTLNPFLDLSTFEILGSSHLVYTNISYPDRAVTFTFDNILLPDSTTDYFGSNGYVRYKIKALPGIPDSTLITNASFIYFDFNPYVATDTTSSLMTYYQYPVAAFNAPNLLCSNGCVDFTSTSLHATSWLWSFTGAVPSSSVDENPQGICYSTNGTYDVTLIASNSVSADTLLLSNYINVSPSPAAPSVYIINDTLFCTFDTGYVAYQWYDSLGIIAGATGSYFVPEFSGTYGVMVFNQSGCSSLTAVSLILEIRENEKNNFEIYPNPAHNQVYIISKVQASSVIIELYDMLGGLMMEKETRVDDRKVIIDISNIPQGIYFIRYISASGTTNKRFVKN